jgi:hypothetical protein
LILALALLPTGQPGGSVHRTVDLDIGETALVVLSNGSKASVRVLDLHESSDAFRSAVREARVTVEVNGSKGELIAGNRLAR